jgi:sulfur-oxidizing protein SoxX
MNTLRIAPLAAAMALSLLSANSVAADLVAGTTHDAVIKELKASFSEKGMAKLSRIDQSVMQRECSQAAMTGKPLSKEQADKIMAAARASVKQPADGKYLGDWKAGEKIAQSGKGWQYSDNPAKPAGGNCYACHDMSKGEISYGNIGPSLRHYGKTRGTSKEVLEYTWSKVYNSHISNACSVMPRFGAAGLLTETQLKDVMALLFDPHSPVNDDSVKVH